MTDNDETFQKSFSEWLKETAKKRAEEDAKRAGVFYARIDELFINESAEEDIQSLKSFY